MDEPITGKILGVRRPEDFAAWVSPHLPALTRLAGRLAPASDRDDCVQEALQRAWVKWSQFDASRGTPASWLLAITADQARRLRRHGRPWALSPVGAHVHSIDDRIDLEYAISKLPEPQRLAVDCFYFVDLSIAETAAVMRCSEGTVKSTLFDARLRLRQNLEISNG
jgi:RNA polymerase sigma factor (sigma-70 family)